jgi:hypothetical protein
MAGRFSIGPTPARTVRNASVRRRLSEVRKVDGSVSRFAVFRRVYIDRAMALCFVDPADAIRAIADSIGREARRQLLGEAVRAWVDEIPEQELEVHYAKALSELDEHDLSMLAAWHGSLEVGQPVPNRDFLMGAFGSLGENRREALKLAAGFRGEEAVDAGVTEDDALELVLGLLSLPRQMELAVEAVELYIWDRAGSEN